MPQEMTRFHRLAQVCKTLFCFSNIIRSRILQPSLNVGEFPNNVPKSCQSGSESTVKLTFIVRKVHNIKSSPYFVETNFTVPIGLYILLGHIACRTLLFFLLWKCSLVTPPSRSYHTFRQINKIENEVVYLFENAPKASFSVRRRHNIWIDWGLTTYDKSRFVIFVNKQMACMV